VSWRLIQPRRIGDADVMGRRPPEWGS